MHQLWDYVRGIKYDAQFQEALWLLAYMILGGLLGYFVRGLYRRFATTASNRDSFSAQFPILIIATILVIFVVKSSLALSLGLVGALSIVRFRAAIKEPEELVYLFFCIALGLALGAQYYMLPVAGVFVFTLFVVAGHYLRRKSQARQFLLTISGKQSDVFDGDLSALTQTVEEVFGQLTVQRFDVEDGQVHFRVSIAPPLSELGSVVAQLQSKLPECRVSYANLENLI